MLKQIVLFDFVTGLFYESNHWNGFKLDIKPKFWHDDNVVQ